VLAASFGPGPAYWFNAASFVVSALLIFRIRGSLEEAARAPSRGHWRDLAEGYGLVRRSRSLLTVLVAWSIAMLGNAGINVAEIVLAKEVFDAGNLGFGILVGAAGLGLVSGSLTAGDWVQNRGLRLPYGLSIVLMSLGAAAAALSPNVWIAAAFVTVSGFGNGAAVVCNALLVQRGAPDRLRGRAFTVLMSTGYTVLGLGMVAAGPLTNAFGARVVWLVAAALFAAAAGAALVLLRDADGRIEVPTPPLPLEHEALLAPEQRRAL